MNKNNMYNEILRLNLGKSYIQGMTQKQILRKGYKAWKLNEQRAKKISFVIFTYNLQIVGVCYIPEPDKNWYKDKKDNTRMRFKEGIMLGDLVTKSQNPIKYLKMPIKINSSK